MTKQEYITPEVEILPLTEDDIIATSNDFVFLPTDEFREI